MSDRLLKRHRSGEQRLIGQVFSIILIHAKINVNLTILKIKYRLTVTLLGISWLPVGVSWDGSIWRDCCWDLRGEDGELGKEREAALRRTGSLFSEPALLHSTGAPSSLPPLPLLPEGLNGHANSQQLEKSSPLAVSKILRPFCIEKEFDPM